MQNKSIYTFLLFYWMYWVRLVNKIILFSGVQVYYMSSVYCVVCSPPQVKSPPITFIPLPLTLYGLGMNPRKSMKNIILSQDSNYFYGGRRVLSMEKAHTGASWSVGNIPGVQVQWASSLVMELKFLHLGRLVRHKPWAQHWPITMVRGISWADWLMSGVQNQSLAREMKFLKFRPGVGSAFPKAHGPRGEGMGIWINSWFF